MKKPLLILLGIALASCTGFDIRKQGYRNLESLPGYVAFNGEGDAVELTLSKKEGDKVDVEVEMPTGSTDQDIVVSYSMSGTAVFGDDYTIEGISQQNGATVTVKPKPKEFLEFDKGTIKITLIKDTTSPEPEETIILYLESATRNGKAVAVGRGGTKHGRTATIKIAEN